MSVHARPLAPLPATAPSGPTLRVVLTAPTPPASGAPPLPPAHAPESRPALAPAEPATARPVTTSPPDARAWYRQEPWLPWLAAAFVPLGAHLTAYELGSSLVGTLRWASVAASAACVLVAVGLLLRQGAFHVARPPRRR